MKCILEGQTASRPALSATKVAAFNSPTFPIERGSSKSGLSFAPSGCQSKGSRRHANLLSVFSVWATHAAQSQNNLWSQICCARPPRKRASVAPGHRARAAAGARRAPWAGLLLNCCYLLPSEAPGKRNPSPCSVFAQNAGLRRLTGLACSWRPAEDRLEGAWW